MSTQTVLESLATSEALPVPIREAEFEDPVPEARLSAPRAHLLRPERAAAVPAGRNPAP